MDEARVRRRPPFGNNPLVGERGASTHRRILDAALEVFAVRGYHATRVEHITEAAGCSRPSFYQYFSSKEEVFWRLAASLGRQLEDLAAGLAEVGPDADGVTRLRTWIDALADLHAANAPVFAAFQVAVRQGGPQARRSGRIGARVGEALVRSTGSAGGDALPGASVVALLRAIHYWEIGLGQIPRARFLDGTARTVHRLLHGPIGAVNTDRASRAPTKRTPRWPDFPGLDDAARPARPRGEKTRQALLEAARRILPERGYHDTRVDDVAEAAGVSHGSFYRYFATKDTLFHVLAEEAARHMVEQVESFPDDPTSADLDGWVEAWFDTYRANGGVISAWQEIHYDDPDLATFSVEIALAVLDRLTRIVHRRGFGDAGVDGLVMLSVLERLPYSVLALDQFGEAEAIAAATTIIRRGLLGVEA